MIFHRELKGYLGGSALRRITWTAVALNDTAYVFSS